MEIFGHLTYLGVDLIILFPFLYKMSDSRLGFRKNAGAIIISVAIVAIVFTLWDILAVRANVWGFNPAYIMDIKFEGLPLEEILFFVAVPVTSLLVWEATGYRKGDR